MKKLAVALLTPMAMAVVPVAIAPVAHADICAGAHGRHFAAGGCTPGIAGDVVAGAAIAAATDTVRSWRRAVLHGRGRAVLHTPWRPLLVRAVAQLLVVPSVRTFEQWWHRLTETCSQRRLASRASGRVRRDVSSIGQPARTLL